MIGELTEEEIEAVLERNVLGRIGCNDGTRNYIVPVNYVYDGKYIIAHSMEGMKIRMMRKNPDICFEVDEIDGFTHWRSVIAWGRYREVLDERERYSAMKLFVNKMMHVKISRTASLSEIQSPQTGHLPGGHSRPIVYRIHLAEKSGRFENE